MSWQPADRVVRLHGLVPDVLSSVFVELEMNNAGGVNGRYAISELDGMRIVRSSTYGGRFQVFRGDCHIRRTRSHSVFLCLPLSGNVIIQQNGRRGTIARGDLGLLDSRAEYEIYVFDACGSAAWESSCRRGAQDRLFEWCRAHCLEIREKRCMGGGWSQRPS